MSRAWRRRLRLVNPANAQDTTVGRPARCATAEHADRPATVWGTFISRAGTTPNTGYCTNCAFVLTETGHFQPEPPVDPTLAQRLRDLADRARRHLTRDTEQINRNFWDSL